MALSISTDLTDSSGKELLEYGTPDFPAAFFYDDFRIVNVSWHWHEELELIYVMEGKQKVTIGRESFDLQAGEGYFCNSSILHKSDALSGICLQEAIVFHPRVIGDENSLYYHKYALPLLKDTGLPYVKLTPDIPWQNRILSQVHAAWIAAKEEKAGYEMTVRYLLGQIMLSVYSNRNTQRPSARSIAQIRTENRVKKMLAFLEENYSEQITIQEIADSADVSVSECLRCFNSVLQTTPVRFLNQYRLDQAGSFLLNSDYPVSEIAAGCGFGDVSYFARAFKKRKGCTPSEYRRKRTPDIC